MIRDLLKLAAMLVVMGISTMAPAAAQSGGQDTWQGLAYRNDGRFGITSARNAASESAARAELRRNCARNGWSCDVAGVSTGCVAMAYSEAQMTFAAAAGPTEQAAIDQAYSDCARFGHACDTVMTACPWRPRP